MAAAGSIVGAALVAVRDAAKAGVSTLELDQVAESVIREAGAVPSFLGYHGFPASICSSVNDQVVHGIPSATAVLADGDLVSIDCGAILDGWHGDSAWTFAVGTVIPSDEALSEATRLSMEAGIAAMIPGNRLTDVSHAIELGTRAAEKQFDRAFGIVDGYGGHGIGRSMHLDPFLPNEELPVRSATRGGIGTRHRTDAHARHHPDSGACRRLDRCHHRRVSCRALGAHGGRHRGRPPHPHHASLAICP